MLTGLLMALAAGFLFGANDVLVRLAALGYRKEHVQLMSLVVGTPLLLLAGLAMGERFPRGGEALVYAVVGVLHFVVGRHLMYTAILGLGASAAAASTAPTVVLSALLGWIILGERISLLVGIALVLAFSSVLLAALRPSGTEMQGVDKRIGVLAGLAASLVFASTAVLIRSANLSGGSPVLGAGISYATALAVFAPLVAALSRQRSTPGGGASHKKLAMLGLLSSAVVVTLAQLLRYLALNLVPVAQVSLLISLFPLHAIVVSRIIGGHTGERIGLSQVMAGVFAVISSFLVFWDSLS